MWYKLKRILIYPDGVTEKQVYPAWWKPNVNTVAYYPLKENVNDYSGNWYNWSWNPNSFAWWVANYSWASTTLPTSIINANPRTVSCWVNDEGVGVGTHNISVYGQHTTVNYGFCLGYNMKNNDNTYRINIVVSGGSGYATSNGVMYSYPTALTWWHHIVFMRDSSKSYLYVDGVYIGNTTYSGQTSSNTFYLWYDHWYDGWAWNGKISELIFEDKTRTAEEILNYYNQTKSKYWI